MEEQESLQQATGLWQEGAAHRWARNFFLLTLVYLTLLFASLLVSGR